MTEYFYIEVSVVGLKQRLHQWTFEISLRNQMCHQALLLTDKMVAISMNLSAHSTNAGCI